MTIVNTISVKTSLFKVINGNYIQGRKLWTLQQMRFWGGKLDYDKDEEEDKKPAKKRK